MYKAHIPAFSQIYTIEEPTLATAQLHTENLTLSHIPAFSQRYTIEEPTLVTAQHHTETSALSQPSIRQHQSGIANDGVQALCFTQQAGSDNSYFPFSYASELSSSATTQPVLSASHPVAQSSFNTTQLPSSTERIPCIPQFSGSYTLEVPASASAPFGTQTSEHSEVQLKSVPYFKAAIDIPITDQACVMFLPNDHYTQT